MKICLINPRFPLSLWDFTLCRDLSGSAFPFPPLSLATLAGLTPAGHEVIIFDENVGLLDVPKDTDIVGITGYHIQEERVFALADGLRKQGMTVAIGGPLVRKENLELCALHADAVFLGEAEYSWPKFMGDVDAGQAQHLYVQNTLVDMEDSPTPRFDLLDLSAYSSAIIETSRGCPHSCEFCEIPVRLGRGSRTKSTDQVMTEITALSKLGVDSIFIIDDNFLGSPARAKELLREIGQFVASVDNRIYFSLQFTIDTAKDEEMLVLLEQANVRRVFIGIETPRQSSLAAVRKVQNTRVDLLEAVRKIQSHNIIVWGAFIVGFDADDQNIFQEQLDFIQAASIPVAMVGILQALPGTPLYDRMKKEGRLRGDEAGGIRGAANSLVDTNIEPRNMTREELVQGYRYLVNSLYEPERFSERVLGAVAQGAGHPVEGGAPVTVKGLMTLLRILRYYLLTTDLRRSRMFLRTLIHTLRHHPKQLQTVLMHLVVYKHLRLVYEQGTAHIGNAPKDPRA
jgi:radical SAM superfamily enzyme YgiQ (UPF0313 family)